MQLENLKKDYLQNVILENEICEKHKQRLVTVKRTNYTVCPRCHTEQQQKIAEDLALKSYLLEQKKKREYFLKEFSLYDSELAEASFNNFEAKTRAQKEDLDFATQQTADYKSGKVGNVVLIGDVGVGKSHLAYSMIKELTKDSDKTAAFVNVVDLLAKLKADFQSESDYVYRLNDLDYLILDDLGTEKISEWSAGIIYSILNARDKTIITTNLEPKFLAQKYGKRLYSRIFKGSTKKDVYRMQNQKDERIKF
ncbi:DnaC-like helicase loader [Streptococcus phage APCM01]|uniref:DnaC-like helicase loader n=1 Tax=Streptococcus phage APCM01 TaxID=1647391 RepID=UPI00067A66A3|nr:DnaC-like helicase loader [Streptococcus phage APCM01]AKI28583.1 DnaC replication protein [Streptococcus phage APCM01]